MRTSTTTSAIIFTIIALFPSSVQGQNGGSLFIQLLNALLSPVIQSVCDSAQTELGLDDTLDCSCDASYIGIFQGVDGSVTCTLPEPRCLLPPLYCADGTIEIDVKGGLFSETEFESDITGCFNVDSGLPLGIASIEDICFSFAPDGLRLGSCTATIGDTECKSCTICESGVDFTFDCSNIDLLPGVLTIPGPKISTCIGLSLIPSNTTSI